MSALAEQNDSTQVTVVGRLTADPVLRRTQTGKSITTFHITPDGQTEPVQIAAWGPTAEAVCKYKKAGDRVEVIGTAEEIAYKPEGEQPRLVTEISASRVNFLD